MSVAEERLELIAEQISAVKQDVDEIKVSIRDLTSAVIRISLIEERQVTTAATLTKLTDMIEKLDCRLRKIEALEPIKLRTSDWVINALTAAAIAAIAFVAAKTGLI
jgi:prefoldin subunit 5